MRFYREIVFTKAPLEHAFRYKDSFQLVPFKAKWYRPKIKRYVVDYPCFLEYNLPDTDGNDIQKQLNKEREICVLLTAFSTYRVFQYDIHASAWGIKIPFYGADIENDAVLCRMRRQTSDFYYPQFHYGRMGKDLVINGFTSVNADGSMRLVKHYISYLSLEHSRYDLNRDREVQFSEDTVHSLDAYYESADSLRKKIFSAAKLINDSIELRQYRESLSFLAGVAALETMADLTVRDETRQVVEECGCCHSIKYSPYTCPKCGRYIWGVTTKVKEFLKKYVSDKDSDVANYNKMYNLRSKITHVGDIFTNDSIFKTSAARKKQELEMSYIVISYARQAIIALMTSGGFAH